MNRPCGTLLPDVFALLQTGRPPAGQRLHTPCPAPTPCGNFRQGVPTQRPAWPFPDRPFPAHDELNRKTENAVPGCRNTGPERGPHRACYIRLHFCSKASVMSLTRLFSSMRWGRSGTKSYLLWLSLINSSTPSKSVSSSPWRKHSMCGWSLVAMEFHWEKRSVRPQ